ncbi:hypothetical protein QQP08_014255 [Theobroma cacao]|nr:hypothetical protein QQP08_014255 [Theobroma cacao]
MHTHDICAAKSPSHKPLKPKLNLNVVRIATGNPIRTVMKTKAETPKAKAMRRPVIAVRWAQDGRPAPKA